jgi:hypothetical protein
MQRVTTGVYEGGGDWLGQVKPLIVSKCEIGPVRENSEIIFLGREIR